MTTLHYEASTHRIRLEGECRNDDGLALRDALEAFGPMAGDHLIVDLTAVTHIDPAVAAEVVRAVRSASRDGKQLTLLRKDGTVVDEALSAAEAAFDHPAG